MRNRKQRRINTTLTKLSTTQLSMLRGSGLVFGKNKKGQYYIDIWLKRELNKK